MLLKTTNSCIPLIQNNINNKMVVITTDDDSSTCSSTVGVLDVTKKPQLEDTDDIVDVEMMGCSPPPLANRMEDRQAERKMVRFNLSANLSYVNTQWIKQDCKRLWYTGRDYNDFKAANKMLVAQIARSEQRLRRSSSSTCTDSDSSFSFSYQGILYRTYEACCYYQITHPVDEADIIDESTAMTTMSDHPFVILEDKTDEDQLRQWLDIATARLGLERSAVRDIARDRHYRYKDLVRNVLEIQTQFELQQQCSGSDDDDDEMMMMVVMVTERDAQAEYLRQVCQSITRPSRLFARQLARAQAAASPLCYHTC